MALSCPPRRWVFPDLVGRAEVDHLVVAGGLSDLGERAGIDRALRFREIFSVGSLEAEIDKAPAVAERRVQPAADRPIALARRVGGRCRTTRSRVLGVRAVWLRARRARLHQDLDQLRRTGGTALDPVPVLRRHVDHRHHRVDPVLKAIRGLTTRSRSPVRLPITRSMESR